MAPIVKKRADAQKYTPLRQETLASIAANRAEDWVDWKAIARYNWGTIEPAEVARAMAETVGIIVDGAFDAFGKLKLKPQDVKFDPDDALPKEILLPQKIAAKNLDMLKIHEVRVGRTTPAAGAAITALDRWFIPEVEDCEIGYRFEGVADVANKSRLDVYASNYCAASKWEKGLGKFTDPANFEGIPVFTRDDGAAEARATKDLKWKGQVETPDSAFKDGVFGCRAEGQDKRHVNVAFSPYTVHVAYWKEDGDKKARLDLRPFWLEFENAAEPKKHAVTAEYTPNDMNPSKITLPFKNDDDIDGGVLIVRDNQKQIVHQAAFKGDQLKKGDRKAEWDGKYHRLARNGKLEDTYVNDTAASPDDVRKNMLFKSTPYDFEVKTWTRKIKTGGDPDPSEIKWKITGAVGIKRGLLQIFDRKGKLVWMKGIPEAKLAVDTEQKLAWDGKYAPGIKNSRDKDKAIEDDMPYRVQIQVHTPENEQRGIALAAMHSEVRLYTHEETRAPDDLRRDPMRENQELQLKLARWWVKPDPPAEATAALYYQYKLTEWGFHPGPLNNEDTDALKTAIREFKRSVPANPAAAPGAFTRLDLNGGIDAPNAAMTAALTAMTDRYKRKPWAVRASVDGCADDPAATDDHVNDALQDITKNVVLWADDRQYYTDNSAKDATGAEYLSGGGAATNMGLAGYRGVMSVQDAKVDVDRTEVASPWAPLRAELRLLGREEHLQDPPVAGRVKEADETRRAAMRRAIGPLRVDWTCFDALYDLDPIKPAIYPDAAQVRTRRYVAQQIWNAKEIAAGRVFLNAKENMGGATGKRPDGEAALKTYHNKLFAEDKAALTPWPAKHEDEGTATVIHDLICKDQKKDEDLFEPEIGAAGIWFNPSNIGGDGYHVCAEVNFKKFGDYDFPNLKVLAARYPTRPQAVSGDIRIWRRMSVRGHGIWSTSEATNWGGTYFDQMRRIYMASHVYPVHEAANGASTPETAVASVFNPADAADQTRFREIIHQNGGNSFVDKTLMKMRPDDLWPWGHQDWMGSNGPRALADGAGATVDAAIAAIEDEMKTPWRAYRAGLLFELVRHIEANGYMRGHVLFEFTSSPETEFIAYDCANGHLSLSLNKRGGAAANEGDACPHGGCAETITELQRVQSGFDRLPQPAVGVAIGSTWLFADQRIRGGVDVGYDTWAHETGHHRHLEHAAKVRPGSALTSHDTETNSTVAWPGTEDAKMQQWDRRCLMGYTKDQLRYPCGKCVLKGRGWRVTALPAIGDDAVEIT